MRLDYLVITISIICSLIFWIADAVFDYSYYGDHNSFLYILINDVPNHDVHIRSIGIMCFLIFGFFMSRALTRIRKSDLALKESQRKLQDQNNLLNRVLESLTYPFFVVDINDFSVKIANPAACKGGAIPTESYCYEFAHKNFEPCRDSGETCLIDEIKRTKAPVMFEHIHYDTNGNPSNIEVYGFPITDAQGNVVQLIEYCIDVTESRRIELDRQRIDKLESIGILAGGIAHDFNNALMSIMGNISLAMIQPDPAKIEKKLKDAEMACLRAKDLTKQLLIFSKGGVPIKKTELISDFIKESVIFALSGSNVRADFKVPNDLLPVNIDEGLMNQVINNLVINATQAMPLGGKIKVLAKNLDINDDSGLPLKVGRYVRMSFEDHGIGIPKENIQRIFDPYFTTKQRGNGLGLTESFSIVRKHEGYITVESTVDVGTTFHIYLLASPDALPIKKADTIKEPIKGEGKILVMDDEKYIRDAIAEMLSKLGYKVTTAIDGFEVIQLYLQAKAEGQPYNLVILDLIVPGDMGGEEAIQKLKKIDTQVKAIVSSGYSSDPIMADYKDYGFNGVIPKPYKIQELSEVVYKVIKDE